jgi:hypothetical protein
MLNVRTEEFAIGTVVNAIAFLAMKEKVASAPLVQMIAPAMVVARTFKTYHMLPCLRTMSRATSKMNLPRHLHITSGMVQRREDAYATLSTAILTAQRECANTALM